MFEIKMHELQENASISCQSNTRPVMYSSYAPVWSKSKVHIEHRGLLLKMIYSRAISDLSGRFCKNKWNHWQPIICGAGCKGLSGVEDFIRFLLRSSI